MRNFLRAVRMALRNRVTLGAVIGTSLLVGVLWGANIGVVYPFVEVLFKGQSLQDWVRDEIAEADKRSGELITTTAALRVRVPALDGDERAAAERELSLAEFDLQAEQDAARRYRALAPYIIQYLPINPFHTLLVIVGALVVGTAVKDAMIVANMMFVARLVESTMFDLRKQFFRQTLRLDLTAFGEQRDSELLSHFTYDMTGLSTGLSTLFGQAIREPLKMAACLTGACFISWRLLLFSLVVAPPALLLMRLLARSLKRAHRRAMEEMSELYGTLTSTFTGIKTVKAFTMEPAERSRFHQSAKKFFQKMMKIAWYSSLTKPVTELLGIGVIASALIAGAYLVLSQETHLLGLRMCDRPLEPASMLLFYALLAGVSDPARKMSAVFGLIQNAVAAADRIFPVMDREPTLVEPRNPATTDRPHATLTFENVTFQYSDDQPVLRGVNLEVPYGETIAIVGPNGCGKSTLVNLVPRFYDPVSGAVRLDDVDLRNMRLRDIRQRIGLVTQKTHLFDDSVLNNIRYGSTQATDAEVVAAAKKAHAHSFIVDKLADGYATNVGEDGGRLSGGQRQRIALARAMLRDPDILILDEATSQVDVESEQAIHSALAEFVKDRTAIMITHRTSTLALADRIVVMEGGQIVAVGDHDELLKSCPLYSRLHDSQLKLSA